MQYINYYQSPLGKILLAADNEGLSGLWFEGQKYYASGLDSEYKMGDLPIFDVAKRWLDIYFEGREPEYMPSLHLSLFGTMFQVDVWRSLMKIPYGTTTTYGKIAQSINSQRNSFKTSARAVGNAVGRNPISIIIPCHRVIGSNGKLTGYAGGIERKKKLLELEKAI